MVHHPVHMLLREAIKRSPFGKDPSDQGMVVFGGALLVRSRRVAEKDPGAAEAKGIKFQGEGVGEFAAVVGQANGEQAFELDRSQFAIEKRKGLCYGGGGVGVTKESQHEGCVHEMDGEENLAAFGAFHGVQLDEGEVGVFVQEEEELGIGAADAAFLVDLKGIVLAFTWAKAELAGQIQVLSGKEAQIEIVVEAFLGKHHGARVRRTNVMDGLALLDERGEEGIQLQHLLLGNSDTGAGFGANELVFGVGGPGGVEAFFQAAAGPVGTTVADIRSMKKARAGLLEVIGTMQVAGRARLAKLLGTRGQ